MADERRLPKGPKTEPIDVIVYEIDMWRRSYAAIAAMRDALQQKYSDDNLYEYNLRIEGFLLHTRNLLAFFTDKHNKATDLKISQPDWAKENVDGRVIQTFIDRADAVDAAHQGEREADTCYNEISKFLSHCADQRYLRFKSWDTDGIFKDLNPVLHDFEATFICARPEPTASFVPASDEAQHTASFSIRKTPIVE